MKKILKFTPILATTIVAMPILLSSCGTTNENINYDGHLFRNKKELINYIMKNISKLEVKKGQKIYATTVGNDTKQFSSYAESVEYVKNQLKRKEVYLRPGFKVDENDHTIGKDDFMERKNSREYVVFMKASIDDGKEHKHHYTFAPSLNSLEGDELLKAKIQIENARVEAAKSYIQVHNAYKFNGIYFSSKNEIKAYIKALKVMPNIKPIKSQGSMLSIDTKENGLLNLEFDKDLNSSSEIPQLFKDTVSKIAKPVLIYKNNSLTNRINIDQSNVANIANTIKDKDLNYIKVSSNGGKITQIVDMDNNTKNKNSHFYGSYFTKSNMGVEGVNDLSNWHETDSSKLPDKVKDLNDIRVLNSIIDYTMKAGGFAGPLDLFNKIKIERQGETFLEYLSEKKNFTNEENYEESITNLIKELGKGVRYNTLNTLVASYSFIIDRMIQNGEGVDAIKKIAKFYNSIAITFDSLVAKNLAPFLIDENASKNFHINYFQSAFNFYDENNSIGGGIDFQTSPFTYYRRLLGRHNDQKNDSNFEAQNREIVFLLLKSWMSTQSMMMSSMIHNQKLFQQWEDKISAHNTYFLRKSIDFTKHKDKDKFWSFKFSKRKNLSSDSEERVSIYSQLEDVNYDYYIPREKNGGIIAIDITKNKIIENIENYLTDIQNMSYDKYEKQIKEKQEELYKNYVTDNFQLQNNSLKVNTLNFIDFNAAMFEELKGKNLSRYNQMERLNQMVSSAVRPFKERLKDLAVSIGTVAAEVAIAAATGGAGAAAEGAKITMVEEEMSAVMRKTSTKISKTSHSSTTLGIGKNFENGKFSVLKHKTHDHFSHEISSTTSELRHKRTTITANQTNKKKESLKAKIAKQLMEQGTPESSAQEMTNNWINVAIGGPIFGLMSLLPEQDGIIGDFINLVKDIQEVEIRILKNVIPGVSTLINIVNSFNKTEKQTYKYSQTEKGTEFYWDGGQVDYSWWGLSSKQVYDIKDLKMIKAQQIIHGYDATKSGYYYGGKFHSDLMELRQQESYKIIRSTKQRNSKKYSKIVKWTIALNDEPQVYKDNLEELIKYVWSKTIPNSKAIYRDNFGAITGSNQVLQDNINKYVESLKPLMIIAYPKDFGASGKVPSNFILPLPYWNGTSAIGKTQDKSKLINSVSKVENKMLYYIFNPNINKDILEEEKKKYANNPDKLKNLEIIENFAKSNIFSQYKQLDELIEKFVSNIVPKHKNVLFRDILDANKFNKINEDFSNDTTFEDISEEWRNNENVIYSYINKYGKEMYFLDKVQALRYIASKKEMNLKHYYSKNTGFLYKFHNRFYRSINEIYASIMKGLKNEK